MQKLFDPVPLGPASLLWEYAIRFERDYKGYCHWHQTCEFLLVHQGRGTVVVNQQAYEIRRGMLFFFQPYQLHQVYADVSPEHPYVRSIFYADPRLIEQRLGSFPLRQSRFEELCRNPDRANAFDLGGRAEWMESIFEQYELALGSDRGENAEELTLLFLQLIQLLPESEDRDSRKEAQHEAGSAYRHSETVMRWIEEHYREEISLEQLAEELQLSAAYLSRVFRKDTGMSLTDYVTARRIKQACRWLESTDLPVERVGTIAGFGNVSYFIQVFKKVVGTTPLKYRHRGE